MRRIFLALALCAGPCLVWAADVPACLKACDKDFSACEAGSHQATPKFCFDSRTVCVDRCDPRGASLKSLMSRQRSADELRSKPPKLTKKQRCEQGCDKQASACQEANGSFELCGNTRKSCLKRC